MPGAGTPPGGSATDTATDTPAAVCGVAGSDPVRLVWRNQLGGSTFQLGTGPGRRFVKWTPGDSGVDLSREIDRLRWAAGQVVVPRVLGRGGDDTGSWLLTSGLPGSHAAGPRWRADPVRAVAGIGAGLRAFHDALPVRTCPFSASAPARLAETRARAAAGLIDPSGWRAEFSGLTVQDALARLADAPTVDLEVVCHGDTCPPNTLLDDDGAPVGHVDLGQLGVADRWADLAVATWSTTWNYGPGWERPLLDAYGIDPDPDRSIYYRLLWQLGP